MNEESTKIHDKPNLEMSKWKLRTWFTANKGNVKKQISRPILTPERKIERINWCNERKIQVTSDTPFYAAFLDEKWFYTTSRRKKAKWLPLGPHEEPGANRMPALRTISRRFSTKVMIMGVVANPIPEHNFDGKIYNKRVSEQIQAVNKSQLEQFHDNNVMNAEIKNQWQRCVTADMTIEEMIDAIDREYEFDITILPKLVIRYCTNRGGRNTWKTLSPDETIEGKMIYVAGSAVPQPLMLAHLCLRVVRMRGEWYEKEVNCDSDFMLRHIPLVGTAMREKYHWVPIKTTLYLIMDNARGHGTNDAIADYVHTMKEVYNIEIIHQVPHGPEMNILDLGVWMSL
jgi:hypothetical protein